MKQIIIPEREFQRLKFYEHLGKKYIRESVPACGDDSFLLSMPGSGQDAPPLLSFGQGEYAKSYTPESRLSLRKQLNTMLARRFRRAGL